MTDFSEHWNRLRDALDGLKHHGWYITRLQFDTRNSQSPAVTGAPSSEPNPYPQTAKPSADSSAINGLRTAGQTGPEEPGKLLNAATETALGTAGAAGSPPAPQTDSVAAPSGERDNGGPHGTQYPPKGGGDHAIHGPGSALGPTTPVTGKEKGNERGATTIATVENLVPFMSQYNGLPRAAFDLYVQMAGPYPPSATTRLNALRALTPEQLGLLLGACKK
jgi:hypothetical protein